MFYRFLFKTEVTAFILIFLFINLPVVEAQEKSFQLDRFAYSGISLDISSHTENARATHWSPDGTMVFITGRNTENVVKYSVEEPWNLFTAEYSEEFDLSNEFGSTEQQSRAHGFFIRDDGKKMWVFNRTEIWEYNLDNPWKLSSVHVNSHKDLSEFVQRGHDIDFTPDGSKIFIDDRNARAVHEADLTESWDITSLSWTYTLDVSDLEEEVRGIQFIQDGTIMLLLDTARQEILQFNLPKPYDLKNALFTTSFDLSKESDNPRGLSVSADLTRIYITGNNHQRIYQYSLQP